MNVPLIKEHRIDKLTGAIKCIDKFPYNRDKQKSCILDIYPGKSEKSVFRGMVIPSLRHLGFIIGRDNFIRLSCDGRLIFNSLNMSEDEQSRVFSTVFMEIDLIQFGIIQHIHHSREAMSSNDLINLIETGSIASKRERISKWLSLLEQVKLLRRTDNETICLDNRYCKSAEENLNWRDKIPFFKDHFLNSYLALRPKHAGIVPVTSLREDVANSAYHRHRFIITAAQFDDLLRNFPLKTQDYEISFGHPMGGDEGLFCHEGRYLKTLSIDFKNG